MRRIDREPEQDSLGSSSREAPQEPRNRPIDTKSIGIWKKHPGRKRAEMLAREPEIKEFLELYYPEERFK
jgi:hypothetical protein